MKAEKAYNPQEPLAITLAREDWETVRGWLDYGRCYHDAKKRECLCSINNKAIANEQAAKHEIAGAEAERLAKIIEAVLYPEQLPTETE